MVKTILIVRNQRQGSSKQYFTDNHILQKVMDVSGAVLFSCLFLDLEYIDLGDYSTFTRQHNEEKS